MNLKKSQFKEIVKDIIRESLSERQYQQTLSEVSPPGKKSERMIHHVKSSLRSSHPDWSEDKITSVAIATAWKSHNKVDESGLTSENTDLDKIVGLVMKKNVKDPQKIEYLVTQLYKHQCGSEPSPEEVTAAIQNHSQLKEASYTVVAPHSYTDAKEDKARTIQTDPKVNETAYKTQGPSAKTFEDSPQLPDAQNNPENA